MNKRIQLSESVVRAGNLLKAKGFSLVAAIFILTTLAVLGAAILKISTVQHVNSAQDVQGARAYLAARAGIEWGLYKQLQGGGGLCTAAGAPVTFALPSLTTLSQFTVTVTCVSAAALGGQQYVMTAVACNQPGAGGCIQGSGNNNPLFIQRIVQIRF